MMKQASGLAKAMLAALVSVLLLAASNLDQGLQYSDLSMPLLVALTIAGIAWLVAGRLSRNPARRDLVAVVLTFGWVLYGHYAGPVESALPMQAHTAKLVVFVLLFAIWIVVASRLGAGGRDVSELSTGLGFALVGMAVIGSALVLVGLRPVGEPATEADVGEASRATADAGDHDLPDIFLIVLDSYSRSDHLLEIYGHDNSEFESELEGLGFLVPRGARANYTTTHQAVAAMLNRDYLENLDVNLDPESTDRSLTYRMLESNRTTAELQAMGYEFVFFRSSYPALSRNRSADRQIPDRIDGEFQLYFTARTILAPIVIGYCVATRCYERSWPFTPESRDEVLAKFTALGDLAAAEGPKFVFAHFLLPHEPFRLNARCEGREPLWPRTFDDAEAAEVSQLYPDQVQCTNQLVLMTVREILDRSKGEPIILVQGDHGYARFPWGRPSDLASTDSLRIRERLAVFAAYRLPGAHAALVPATSSPVNLFRLIFSFYFGREDLPRVEDRSYWSSWDAPFDLTLVPPGT